MGRMADVTIQGLSGPLSLEFICTIQLILISLWKKHFPKVNLASSLLSGFSPDFVEVGVLEHAPAKSLSR